MKVDNWQEWLLDKYYDIVPHDYKPRELWYKLKCFLFKRYSTVKSRHLGHTWVDKVELIPYTLFEMLENFVEKECSPGCVEWYGEYGHKILVGMEYKYVRDEIDDILRWWNEEFIPYSQGKNPKLEALWKLEKEIAGNRNFFDFGFENGEYEGFGKIYTYDPERTLGKEKYKEYQNIHKQIWEFEDKMDQKLEEMCHRIINIRRYLWT